MSGARLAQIVRGSEFLIVRFAVVSDVSLTAKSFGAKKKLKSFSFFFLTLSTPIEEMLFISALLFDYLHIHF